VTSVSSPAKAIPACYRFGPFRLQPHPGVLYRGGELVALAPKAFGVLLLLVENAGNVVPKQEILDKVWAGLFVEDTSLTKNISILRKILNEGFPGAEVIRTVSKVGYQLAVLVSLEPEAAAATPVVPPSVVPATRRSRLGLRALAGVAVLVALLGVWSVRARILLRSPRSSVAVISFHDLSGKPENAWLSRAVSEMLTTELDADTRLRSLPGDVVSRLRADLALPDQSGFSSETLARIRQAADCDYVVSGSYLSLGGNVRLDVRVQDTRKPESTAAMSFSGSEKNLPELAVKAGAEIRARFGVPRLSGTEEARARSSLPSDGEARRQYSEALEKLGAFDPAGARQLLEQVIVFEPNFAGGHMALSSALLQMGYDRKAREEALRARDLSRDLPREERLMVEARYQETAGQWDKAAEIYTSLWTFYPDNAEYGLSLAHAQTAGGKATLADATLAKLRTSSSPPTVALAALAAAESDVARSDYKKASRDYADTIAEARKLRSPLLEGRAEAGLALVYEKAGDTTKSAAAWQTAIRLCTDAGDFGCVAAALNNQAAQLMDLDDRAGSLSILDRALQLSRRTGNRGQEGRALNIRAMNLYRDGDFKSAQEVLVQCLDIARDLGDLRLTGIALRRLGDIASRTGDEPAALRFYNEEMQTARRTGDKSDLSTALDSVGRTEQRQGDLAGARRDLEEALTLKRELGNDSGTATTLSFLANVLKNQGDLETARKLRAEECALTVSSNRKAAVQRCLVAVAELDLLLGRFREAASAAQPIAEAAKSVNPGAEANRILALARLAQGDTAGARTAIREAQAWTAKGKDLLVSAAVATAAGRIESATGHKREASAFFQRAAIQAKQADTMSLILDNRLAMAEAAVRDGDKAARKQLTDISTDSAQRGYGFYASRAQKLTSELK
jgi:DNA-binding winged helix-turn-helix (wHTH) protein/tetratricopeptide (TPR) repeat protein